jgi:hypothetical protein
MFLINHALKFKYQPACSKVNHWTSKVTSRDSDSLEILNAAELALPHFFYLRVETGPVSETHSIWYIEIM